MSASTEDGDILDRRDFMICFLAAAGEAAIAIGQAGNPSARRNLRGKQDYVRLSHRRYVGAGNHIGVHYSPPTRLDRSRETQAMLSVDITSR
jgi:hypothetical protein